MQQNESALNVYRKLLECSREVKATPKTGKNLKQGFRYTPVEDILFECRDALFKAGLIIRSTCVDQVRELGTSSSGGTMHFCYLTVEYIIVDAETGEHTAPQVYYGHGADVSDKSVSKAYTSALKYYLRDLFLIPFGEEPDADESDDVAGTSVSTLTKEAVAARDAALSNSEDGWSDDFGPKKNVSPRPASEKQINLILSMLRRVGIEDPNTVVAILKHLKMPPFKSMESRQASHVINKIKEWAGEVDSFGFSSELLTAKIISILESLPPGVDTETGEVLTNTEPGLPK